MFMLKRLILAGALSVIGATAQAAVVASDISGAADVKSEALPPAGFAAPDDATVFAGEAYEGTLSAAGGLFDTGVSLSTDFDSDPIMASFTAPIFGLQFTGGITDEFGDFLDGTVTLTVDGMTVSFATSASGPDGIGVQSDTGFSSATLAITAFDTGASAIAFLDLSDILVLDVNPIPLPSSALLLLGAIGGLAVARRRARPQ